MNGADSDPAGAHPLAGVLDRLLARERGTYRPPVVRNAAPVPSAENLVGAAPAFEPGRRRMLVIAGLGADEGSEVRRSLARWTLGAGRLPACVDIGFPDDPAPAPEPVDGARIPWVGLPFAPERLKLEAPEAQTAILSGLRRHEVSADVLLVRVSSRCSKTLMRAAFLAGGLVVPLEDAYDEIYRAYQISRELLESFLDLAVWPAPRDPGSLERYQAMMRGVLDSIPAPLGNGDGPDLVLARLAAPPDEGFLVSLVDPDAPVPATPMLQTGSLRL